MKQKYKTYLIVLAAGNSSRMGKPKGLLTFNSMSLIKQHQNAFLQTQIIIVAGKDFNNYAQEIISPNTLLIKNNFPERGQFFSLTVALNKIDLTLPSRIFITPIDKVPPTISTIALMKRSKKYAIIPTFHSKKGHPILINNQFAKKLNIISYKNPDARLDKQLQKLKKEDIELIEINDPTIIQNFNYPEDLPKN